jgi:hypothetical protein
MGVAYQGGTMARAALIPQARGTRVHSTGTHRRLDRAPIAEPSYDGGNIGPNGGYVVDVENDLATFERMMRNNRAVGL